MKVTLFLLALSVCCNAAELTAKVTIPDDQLASVVAAIEKFRLSSPEPGGGGGVSPRFPDQQSLLDEVLATAIRNILLRFPSEEMQAEQAKIAKSQALLQKQIGSIKPKQEAVQPGKPLR